MEYMTNVQIAEACEFSANALDTVKPSDMGESLAVNQAADVLRWAAFRLRAVMAWQPIESAPKDGREVLLMVERRAGIPHKMLVGHYMPGGHCIEDHPAIDSGWYFWNGCMFDLASKPTHWMPLPAPPLARPTED